MRNRLPSYPCNTLFEMGTLHRIINWSIDLRLIWIVLPVYMYEEQWLLSSPRIPRERKSPFSDHNTNIRALISIKHWIWCDEEAEGIRFYPAVPPRWQLPIKFSTAVSGCGVLLLGNLPKQLWPIDRKGKSLSNFFPPFSNPVLDKSTRPTLLNWKYIYIYISIYFFKKIFWYEIIRLMS